MPDLDFFAKLGLFVVNDFLNTEECRVLCNDIRNAARAPATVVTDGQSFVDISIRNASAAKVTNESRALIMGRLEQLKPNIENHFNLALTTIEQPHYLRYGKRDYFSVHADADTYPPESSSIPHRKVSAIIFLNNQSGKNSKCEYSGGSLILYGIMDDPRSKDYGFSVDAVQGQLIAFPALTLHEVTPVTAGERFTVASWFY
ncbi:MAG: 2OG-Fe(II) oxygenase [Gammaproteobacteria bacterium]|nr:2OG-Fe(II) oxygenase [Gammaproteobacteria bacterium]